MSRLSHSAIVFTLAACLAYGLTTAQTLPRGISEADSNVTAAVSIVSLVPAPERTPANDDQSLSSEFAPLSLLSTSLWDRLNEGFTFSDVDNARVDNQIQFLQKGLASLETNLAASKPYLYHIIDQLERARIPLDIALLPLIESAFNPTARSSENAVGVWQFIPSTATHYGLAVGKHYDQRLDVIASTTAATRYLQDLNKMFDGDWLLTLAAYNTGPGNVRNAIRRAIDRGVEPTYWNLDLSYETTNYVPRLIAATKIVSDAEKFKLTLPLVPDRKLIESISVGRRVSMQQVAELTSATFDEINDLNPGLQNGMTPIHGPHQIVVPIDIAKQLLKRLEKMKRLPLVDRQTQLELLRRNISTPLVIDSGVLSDSGLLDRKSYSSSLTSHFQTHTVVDGDTLWSLSKKVGVDVATLRSWNNLSDDEPIKTGDSLNIAYVANTPDADSAGLMNYRVIPADSLSSIASRFDLAVGDIRKWNSSVRNEDYIQAGQILRIPTYPQKYSP